MAIASCCLSTAEVFLSSVLYALHSEDQLSRAHAIAMYIARVESYDYGMRHLSAILLLPNPFFWWTILTFSGAFVVALLEQMGMFAFAILLSAMACGGLPLVFLLYPRVKSGDTTPQISQILITDGQISEALDPNNVPNGGTPSSNIRHLDMTGKIKPERKIYSGSGSDVFQGTLQDDAGEKFLVAVKVIRVCTRPGKLNNEHRLQRRFERVLPVSSELHHPNITPLLGFTMASDLSAPPALISPWYSNGNVVEYLKYYPWASRPHLLYDSIKGLEYIHSLSLVHGDIKGENILVNDAGFACLTDFDNSSFVEETPLVNSMNSSGRWGTQRFLSPEEWLTDGPKTLRTDIWKIGCTAIQIMTDKTPYHDITNLYTLALKVISKVPPIELHTDARTAEERIIWEHLRTCWHFEPDARPCAVLLRANIEAAIARDYAPEHSS